jgi:Nucleotidyl transferase AbiEii toxin, Type IV TA system
MHDSYFQLSVKNQASAIDAASEASGRAPHLLEKDIWVVWALAGLFQSELGAHLVFKGGTALSKAHKNGNLHRRTYSICRLSFSSRVRIRSICLSDSCFLPSARLA